MISKIISPIEKFINDKKIIIETKKISANPNIDEWKESDHWEIVFRYAEIIKKKDRQGAYKIINYLNDNKLVTYFSKGLTHDGKKPTVEEVLDCLASDSSSVENEDMDSWIESMGYNTKSMKEIRKAEETYRIITKQSRKLKEFLGNKAYEELLWETERL